MKVFLTDKEVIELAYDALDMHCPNPDKVHDIALRMDMVYDEYLDMYEDVECVMDRIRTQKRLNKDPFKYENKMIVRK